MSTVPWQLADVNVWLATLVAEHPHHAAVTAWWRAQTKRRPVAFCRITQLGLVRLLTNPRVMGDARQSVPQAWDTYLRTARQSLVTYSDEPKSLDEHLGQLVGRGHRSPYFWTDAYLAAFALAAGARFVTFDSGFRRFPGLDLDLLTGRKNTRGGV